MVLYLKQITYTDQDNSNRTFHKKIVDTESISNYIIIPGSIAAVSDHTMFYFKK